MNTIQSDQIRFFVSINMQGDVNLIQINNDYYNNPQTINNQRQTQAMVNAQNGIEIPHNLFHNPIIQDINGNTVAMFYGQRQKIPPRQWMHDETIKNKQYLSLQEILELNQVPIPQHWHDNDMNIFDQACFKIIPDITNHRSYEQNKDQITVAMIFAFNNSYIPKQWQHDPYLRNIYGYTVALYQAKNGTIPDKKWYHYRFIRVKYFDTLRNKIVYYSVKNFLNKNNIIVPECWNYDTHDSENNTIYMIYTEIININNDPRIIQQPWQTNIYGQTVAQIATLKNIKVSLLWLVNIKHEDAFGQSIFNILKNRHIEIPDYITFQNNLERCYPKKQLI